MAGFDKPALGENGRREDLAEDEHRGHSRSSYRPIFQTV